MTRTYWSDTEGHPCETDGKRETICMTKYNAQRVFGALSMLLGLQVTAASAKRMRF